MGKCKKVHIGIFFDGTGNNKVNDTPSGAQSNIAKLSEFYLQGKIPNWSNEQCEHYAHRIYVNGVGTTDGVRDYIKDKTDKGAGGGGAKRINETIDKLVDLLDKKNGVYSVNNDYRERIIDVFGFSRGAAMARDFINTFNDRNYRFFHLTKIRFNFVGIYDTVGSFGEAGNNDNFKPKNTDSIKPNMEGVPSVLKPLIQTSVDVTNYLNDNFLNSEAHDVLSDYQTTSKTAYDMKSAEAIEKEMLHDGWSLKNTQMSAGGPPYTMTFQRINPDFEAYNFDLASYSADKIIHIVASDEVRKNFPLTSISGSGGEEWAYAGVHSDVGGGYKPVAHEPHGMSLGVYPSPRSAISKATSLKSSYPPDAKFTTEQVSFPSLATRLNVEWNRTLTNDLTFVTLHRMHEQAISNGVPFKTMNIPMPSSMHKYDLFTKANPSDAMSFPEIPTLKKGFYHHSAVDQEDVDTHYDGHTSIKDMLLEDSPDSRTFGGNDTRYENHKPKRDVFKNKPTNAIKPFKG